MDRYRLGISDCDDIPMAMHINKTKLRNGFLLFLLIAVLTSGMYALGLFERIEWITYDTRMQLHRQDAPLDPSIAVVLIDEASLQAMDPIVGRWPWPRSVYAELLDYFSTGGARAVAFDLLFTEHEHNTGSGKTHPNEQRFIKAAQQSGIAYQAMQVLRESPSDKDSPQLNRPMPDTFLSTHTLGETTGIADTGNNSYLLPIEGLYSSARGVGIVEVEPDSDGVYRRVRLFSRYQDHVFPSLAIAPLLDEAPIRQSGHWIKAGSHEIPLDNGDHYLINLAGDIQPYSISGILSSIQHLQRGDIENVLLFPDEFADKIVYVGASAIGLEDIKTTPLSSKTPGVFLHASIASNLLQREFLRPVDVTLTLGLIIGFSLLTVSGYIWLHSIVVQNLLPMLTATAYVAWGAWRFGLGEVYHLSAPLTAILLAWLLGSAFRLFTEGSDKRRVKGMLSQYVSPAVMNEVMARYDQHLAAEVGKSENLSILFSDIRGFTTISENLPAEQVVDLLNIYFSEMTEIIFEHEGTLDKFIGDAIMAFWGAPIRITDHADRAVHAAIRMQRGLVKVNEILSAKGRPTIVVGLGISTGDVVLGNIGSARKLDYTVIGDNVNLASRIEGLTKQYGCPLLISEYTYRAQTRPLPCVMVDMVRVKGKQVPIRLYWPLVLPEDNPYEREHARRTAELSEEAFASYLKRDWDMAITLYSQLAEGKLRELFIQRCQAYKQVSPADDWDGVYTLTTK